MRRLVPINGNSERWKLHQTRFHSLKASGGSSLADWSAVMGCQWHACSAEMLHLLLSSVVVQKSWRWLCVWSYGALEWQYLASVGLGSGVKQSRKVRLQSLEVSQSLSELIGARWCQMVPDGARWCQMVPDGARWCQMCIWGVWPRPRRSRWARPGGSNSFVGDPEPDLQVGTRNPWDIWKWWDTFNILHKILHKILHNIILYKALNNIKLNRRSLVWTTTIVNHLNIADEPWARKNRATSAPKDPKGKNEVATYYSLDSYDSYIYI